jgi:hypothetical protein
MLTVTVVFAWSIADVSAQDDESSKNEDSAVLESRIDFGNAYIMGQSITSGSVYLLHRKKSDIDSMLKIRTDYRKEIMEEHYLEDTGIVEENEEKKSDANRKGTASSIR